MVDTYSFCGRYQMVLISDLFRQQSTRKEDHYQRQKVANLYHSLSIKSSVKALALSSGVGNNRTHPLLRAP